MPNVNIKTLLYTIGVRDPDTLFVAGESSCTTKVIVHLTLKQPTSLIISSFDDYEARRDTVRF
jgi:hypothetical protein